LQNLQQKTKNNACGAQRGAFSVLMREFIGCAQFFSILREMLLAQKAGIYADCHVVREKKPPGRRVLPGGMDSNGVLPAVLHIG
jgi:hypothetical protein